MVDGYIQIYRNGFDIIISFWRNGHTLDLVDSRICRYYNFNMWALAHKKERKGGIKWVH